MKNVENIKGLTDEEVILSRENNGSNELIK